MAKRKPRKIAVSKTTYETYNVLFSIQMLSEHLREIKEQGRVNEALLAKAIALIGEVRSLIPPEENSDESGDR